jgi:Mg2+-importing ATPase
MTETYWSATTDELLLQLSSRKEGLSQEEAQQRRAVSTQLHEGRHIGDLRLLLQQFKSPITLLLIASAILSFFLGERSDAFIILLILLISALLGFYQERGAAGALQRLLQMVQVRVSVLRDGKENSLAPETVVPGDVVVLIAGNTIPGDCRLLQSKDLYTNESSLTGETFPVEKKCGVLPTGTLLSQRTNCLFMGTHVISGTAHALVVHTGAQTEFGAISGRLRRQQPETEFERGIRRLGYLLMEVTLLLVLVIFCINVFLHKPVLDSFLFSLAIAVGLTPQLLPAIISINLSRGAASMARQSVIVKRLSSIENLGSMDVFCTDKTGTITTGQIILYKTLNYLGTDDQKVFRLAYFNAFFEKGFSNPIDEAICNFGKPDMKGINKLDELPYDFSRKRLSILVEGAPIPSANPSSIASPSGTPATNALMVTKGALDNIIAVCSYVAGPDGKFIPMADAKASIYKQFCDHSAEGYRTLGMAYRTLSADTRELKSDDEQDMIFAGMLLFTDPPKPGIAATLTQLKQLGISLKIITGDNELVAAHIAQQIGMGSRILRGGEIKDMNVEALSLQAPNIDVFAGVEPNQKEKILLALKKAGHVVGYMGDGINDAPALHCADVSISVNGAADVAKESADIVLLTNDLQVLTQGVREGRKTFANTLKYVFMATSANFGNMFSMAGASLFLPFLPLLPKQVLLTNLLTDIPEMTIATDTVDDALIDKPHRIDLHFIKRFMVVFGIISSVFDYATFALLLFWLKAGQAEFRTGWFVESVISASLIVLVVRTAQPFYRNRASRYLLLSTGTVVLLTLLLPVTPLARVFGFVALPLRLYAAVIMIIAIYMVTAETAKRIFYRRRSI